ncbi:toll-like receptor 13 [Anneissia japonica]|uniref:toll-like receptor 13 n=1 Tax=Anneissia japonica TaxID=1529436 RepID=UPI0014259E18|nr:toll-like receptor 13 [Anneissia japonica]
MTDGLLSTLMKMECYPFLICFALFASFTCTLPLTCYNYDPLSINGTQPPDDLLCPERCNCTYCANRGTPILKYRHDVDCSNRQLANIPLKNTVPTDVAFYFLQNNIIKSLKNNSFKTLHALEYLRLSHNKLYYSSIESDAFSGLRKLSDLSMSNNNYLSKLQAEWFVDLVSLERLHLDFCGITTLESDVFKHCKYLKKVDLSDNEIVSFPTTLFQNMSALMFLYMHHNKIGKLPNQAFVHSNRMQAISLHDNSITAIKENVGFQNLNQLQILYVSYNKFSCDCNLVWFRNWIDKTNVTLEDIGDTKCTYGQRKVYIKLLDFDPDTIQCSKLFKILRITISSVSAGVTIVIIGSILYCFRYDLRYWNQRRRLRKQYEKINNQGPPPIDGENIKYDAFVSYNSKDQHWIISVLQPSLEIDRNFKLCVDYRDFIVGEAVVDNIANAVKYSRKVLLVVSKNFIKSEWCYFELEMARMRMFDNHEDILVVVVLEKVSAKDMPILLHKILTTKTYIEWEEHPEGQALFWVKLEAALLSPNCPKYRLLNNPQE